MRRQHRVKAFGDGLCADHSNRRLVIANGMGRDQQTNHGPCRGEWHGKAIGAIAKASACRMGDLGIRG